MALGYVFRAFLGYCARVIDEEFRVKVRVLCSGIRAWSAVSRWVQFCRRPLR